MLGKLSLKPFGSFEFERLQVDESFIEVANHHSNVFEEGNEKGLVVFEPLEGVFEGESEENGLDCDLFEFVLVELFELVFVPLDLAVVVVFVV